jgi:nucleoid-associated protein YgaU
LIRKFVLIPDSTSPAAETAPAVSSDLFAAPQSEKPTVVTAQKDAAGQTAGQAEGGAWTRHGRGEYGSDASDVPHGSFMPSEPATEEPPANSRYAQQGTTEPDENDTPSAPAASNPFAGGQPSEQPQSRVTGTPKAPKSLDVAPGGASALDARKPPERTKRNPLRRLSAETPLDEAPGRAVFPEAPQASPSREPEAADSGATDGDGSAPNADYDIAEPAPAEQSAAEAPPITDELPDEMPAEEPSRSRYDPPATSGVEQPAVEPAPPADGRYTIQPNDSLWKISEKVYGHGRYFKAIHEHNRAKMPYPDRLTAGEVIEVPPPGILEERYPDLCPKQRRSAVVKTRTQPANPRPRSSADTYVVEEGDTLFDIARYELGKASRWGEIYELNRDVLGEDFDYLQPGLELKLPPRNAGGEAVSQEPSSRYLR